MLRNLQKTNLKVLFRNRRFYIVLCAVLAYVLFPTLVESMQMYKTDQATLSAAYVYFGQAQVSVVHTFDSYGLFFIMLFPFAVSLAYSDCNFEEKQYGSDRIVIARVGRSHYYTAQWLTVFIAGALIIWIPLVIQKLVFMTAIPLDSLKITPTYPLDPYTAFYNLSYWKPLLYNHPYIYFFLYDFITAFLGGTFCIAFLCPFCSYQAESFSSIDCPGNLLYHCWLAGRSWERKIYAYCMDGTAFPGGRYKAVLSPMRSGCAFALRFSRAACKNSCEAG